mgnify:CR=1 FL=1
MNSPVPDIAFPRSSTSRRSPLTRCLRPLLLFAALAGGPALAMPLQPLADHPGPLRVKGVRGKAWYVPSTLDTIKWGYLPNASDKPVLIFSLEMPSEQIMMRMLASLGRIDQVKVRTGQLDDEDWARLSSAIELLNSKGKMYIDDSSGLTPTEVRSRARRVAREHGGLSMIMVDYLQLMKVPAFSDNRTLEIAEISRSLKALAKELKVPVIALSQLNRTLEQRADKRPVNSDLRESGSIEQDADLIMFIYRDEVYNDDSPDKGTAEVIIGKQRNGPIGRIRLTFHGRYSRFDNYAGTARFEDEY